jgi:hypothetical protein
MKLIAYAGKAEVYDIEDDDPVLGKRVVIVRGAITTAPIFLQNAITKMPMDVWRWVNPPTE